MRGFPKIRSTFLGVPIIRTIIFWGIYWGPLILGNYHEASSSKRHDAQATHGALSIFGANTHFQTSSCPAELRQQLKQGCPEIGDP